MPILNPWIIVGALVSALIMFGTGYETGHKSGVNAQKIADQSAIDKVTTQIAENKRQANADIINAQNSVIAMQEERDRIKTQLSQEHQTNVETTNRLRAAYDAYGLRFRADPAGCGTSGPDSVPAKDDSSGNDGTAVCQLSDEVTKSLRSIVYEADQLRDDYKLLYDWANALQ